MRKLALGLAVFLFGVAPALAHPHVFVIVKSDLVFSGGKVTAVRQSWTFDEMYTAFAITGFGKDAQKPTPEQLQPVAQQNMEDLAEYKYFTVLKSAGKTVTYRPPTDYSAELTGPNNTLTLRFTLPLTTPASAGRVMTLEVYDPTYFVAFGFDDKEGTRLVDAPTGCSTSEVKPKPLTADDQAALSESFFTNMLPGTDFGVKLADRVVIACP